MVWYEACTDRSGHTFWCAVYCKNIYCKLVQTGLAILFGVPSIAKIYAKIFIALSIGIIFIETAKVYLTCIKQQKSTILQIKNMFCNYYVCSQQNTYKFGGIRCNF